MTNKEGKCTNAHEHSCVHHCCNSCEPLVPCPTCQGLGLIPAAERAPLGRFFIPRVPQPSLFFNRPSPFYPPVFYPVQHPANVCHLYQLRPDTSPYWPQDGSLQKDFPKTDRHKCKKVPKQNSTEEVKTKPDDVSVDCRKKEDGKRQESNQETEERRNETEEEYLKSSGDHWTKKENATDNRPMAYGGGDGNPEESIEKCEVVHQTSGLKEWEDEHSNEIVEDNVTTETVSSENEDITTLREEPLMKNHEITWDDYQEEARELEEVNQTTWRKEDQTREQVYEEREFETSEIQQVKHEQEYWDDIQEAADGGFEVERQEVLGVTEGKYQEDTWEQEFWGEIQEAEGELEESQEVLETIEGEDQDFIWEQEDWNESQEVAEEEEKKERKACREREGPEGKRERKVREYPLETLKELETEDLDNTQDGVEELEDDQEAIWKPKERGNLTERVRDHKSIHEGGELTQQQMKELQWEVLGVNEEFTELESEFFESGPSSGVSFHLNDLTDPLNHKRETVGENNEDKYEMRKIVKVHEAAVQVPHDMFSSESQIFESVDKTSLSEFTPDKHISQETNVKCQCDTSKHCQCQKNKTEPKILTTQKLGQGDEKGSTKKGQTRSQNLRKELTLRRVVSKEVISLKKGTSSPNVSNKDTGKSKKLETEEGSLNERGNFKSENKIPTTERGRHVIKPKGIMPNNTKKSPLTVKGNRWNY